MLAFMSGRRAGVRLFLPAIFLIVLGHSAVKAQTGITLSQTKGIDSVFYAFMRTWNITGGSVAIARDGRLFYHRGFGYSDAQHTRQAQPDDLYRIASISKPLTALGIMKLIEGGKLSADARVFGQGAILNQDYYLSAINDQRILDIRVLDLLEHSSGWDRLVPYGPYQHSDAPFFPLHVTQTQEEANPVGDSTLIRFMLKMGVNYAPGTHYSYSNVGYLILGKVIEKISGERYETFMRKNVLESAGAYDTHLGKNLPQEKLERETDYIYTELVPSCYGDGALVPAPYGGFNLEAMNAHGGWVSSAADLCRVLAAIDGLDNRADILLPETRAFMLQPGSVNSKYARGWSVNSTGNYWHTGSLDGTSAYVCSTHDGYTWAILFNSRSDNSAAYWHAFDRLPWNALKTLNSVPDIDLFSPFENARINYATVNEGVLHIDWTPGSGDGRIIVASLDKQAPFYPEQGKSYEAGQQLDFNSRYAVLYNGNGSNVSVHAPQPGFTYYITVYEYFKNSGTLFREVYAIERRSRIKITDGKEAELSY